MELTWNWNQLQAHNYYKTPKSILLCFKARKKLSITAENACAEGSEIGTEESLADVAQNTNEGNLELAAPANLTKSMEFSDWAPENLRINLMFRITSLNYSSFIIFSKFWFLLK